MKHSKYGIVNYFIKKAMFDETIEIFGEGNQLRDYIYVEDIVSATLSAGVTKSADGEVFNLGSGRSISFLEMAHTVVKSVAKGSIKKIQWPENYKIIEGGDFDCDVNKANKILNWKSKYSFTERIEKTVQFYEKYGKYYW